MEYKEIMRQFSLTYGKEISVDEFLRKLKQAKDDIDLLDNVEKVIREKAKNILGRMQKSITDNRNYKITIEERKLVIRILTKLSKVVLNNEEEKRYIESLSEFFIKSLDISSRNNNFNNTKSKFNQWW